MSKEIARTLLDTQPEPPKSHLRYRINAMRGLSGRKRALPSHYILDSSSHLPSQDLDLRTEMGEGNGKTVAFLEEEEGGEFAFAATAYSVVESEGEIVVKVVRTGPVGKTEASVHFRTIDGTATSPEDFTAQSGVLTFPKGEYSQNITIPIVDDDEAEEDEEFYVVLSQPSPGYKINKQKGKTTVTIIDDDEKSIVNFVEKNVRVLESAGVVELKVKRENGTDGKATVEYYTEDGTAKAGEDYISTKGTITFEHKESEKIITIPIVDDDIPENDEYFYVILRNPSFALALGKATKCKVTIEDDDNLNTMVGKISSIMKNRAGGIPVASIKLTLVFSVGTKSWKEQIENAVTVGGEVDELGDPLPPTLVDIILHCLSFNWKVLFSIIPPTTYLGGWLTFFCALVFIGVVTAIVGELASLFGCVVGLKDSVTAISFVALGTSLPDLFASKQAATESSNADASIGNVTGSNSVNVFLGLGLPWTIGAIYGLVKGQPFVAPAGDLGFSVTLFLACAVLCFLILLLRRFVKFFGGELGGNVVLKFVCGGFIIGLWIFYVIISSLNAYGHLRR